jgi:hypothetical protein
MTSLTICPACQKPLAIPPDTHETATVQCPLCDEEFKLTDAVPDDLPMLAVIDPGTPDLAAAEGETAEEGEFQFDLGQFQPASDESDDTAVKEGEPEEGAADEDEGKEEGDDFKLVADEPAADAAVFDFGAAEGAGAFGEGDAEAATAMATATAKAPKKAAKRFGWKTNLAGMVIFGMIGLALGYGILKLIKPAAAEPIDKKIAAAWDSVSSLWSSGEGTSTDDDQDQGDDKGGSATEDGGDDFVIGGMLGAGKQPSPADIAKAVPPGNKKGKNKKGKKGKDDDTFTPTPVDVDPFGKSTDPFGKSDDPPSAAPAPFASLLSGQPDVAGVIESVDAGELTAKLDKARSDAADDDTIAPALFFDMCRLAHLVAFARDDADSQNQTEAADLVRQLATPEKHGRLSAFSQQMLFSDKRPKDIKGIFLVGKVLLVVRIGDVHATEIEVGKEDDSRRLLVLTEERPDVSVHDIAGVLGSVVRDPQSKLPGFDPQDEALERTSADNTVVILGGVATRLPKE